MSFSLGDIENDVLAVLGSTNPQPNFGLLGSPTYPNWGAISSPARFPQAMIDTAVNLAVEKVIRGLSDTDRITFGFTFPTISGQYSYVIPQGNVAQGNLVLTGTPRAGVNLTLTIGGSSIVYTTTPADTSLGGIIARLISLINASSVITAVVMPVSPQTNSLNTILFTAPATGVAGNAITLAASSSDAFPNPLTLTTSDVTLTGGTAASPLIMQVRRVWYQPYGMPYLREMVPGGRLIAWSKFQQLNAAGYLSAYSFGSEPEVCSVAPSACALDFYPATMSAGDLVTVTYVPQLTYGTGAPYLINQSDVIPLPDEMRDLVLTATMIRMWPVAGEWGLRTAAIAEFKSELERTRQQWESRSSGETLQITDIRDVQANTGWWQQ